MALAARSILCGCVLWACVAPPARGQEISLPSQPGAPWTVPDDPQDQSLEDLLRNAVQARLRTERQQVAGEIRRGLLYDEEDIDAALVLLAGDGEVSQQDNLDRICRALAMVDLRFGKAYEQFQDGRYEQAAQEAEPPPGVQEFTYLTAAKLYLRAEALARAGEDEKAIETWELLLSTMPDRLSFAAEAAVRAGQTYEKLGRFQYAARVYQQCVADYGLSIGEDRLRGLREKVEEYRQLYRDPLNAVAEKIGFVQRRLDAGDSSEQTREDQEWIVAVLEDLIKTAEEQQGGGQSAPSQSQRRRQQRQAATPARPRPGGGTGATRQPSSPARGPGSPAGVAPLVPGETAVRPTDEAGDWAKLPPRERERIERIRRKLIPQRYRSAISDYHTRMAEQGGRE